MVGTIKLRRYAAPAAKRQEAQHFRAGGAEKTAPGTPEGATDRTGGTKTCLPYFRGSSGPLKEWSSTTG